MADYTIEADEFATALTGILRELQLNVEERVPGAVRKSVQKGRKVTVKVANAQGFHKGKTWPRYIKGFSYKVKSNGAETEGVIYNKNTPGLVHLLEKGHARVGGGKVPGRPHVIDGAHATFDELDIQLDKAVAEALEAL